MCSVFIHVENEEKVKVVRVVGDCQAVREAGGLRISNGCNLPRG